MNDFSIIAEDGLTLDDLRELVNRTKDCDGTIPVTIHYVESDDDSAKEAAYYADLNSISIYNYC